MNVGNEKLKIGELAEVTGITKRTIDYYTNLGLLKAERSTSNYRFYTSETIEQLHKIEEMKASGMSLQDIKKSIKQENKYEEIDLHEIRLHMQTLKNEISTLLDQMQQQEQTTQTSIKNKVSSESVALMQTLLLLIT
ncbi:DNA-binding transcriptional MerR regulator [Lysinibacillus composti]|uniref:MerR family transcriptional regulator n=1 Tax=Lysinibacillus composti TaxID=720633 RepID=A0A3N9UL81_9BACI|nr:MerR family transcriptional regulator [Lysinibacillus composti]MBM7607395.1 DNA-binding transcriptional MerR regulator [Lysinibacillus composti]RQW76048.1 MerR family transcriptional regulator [Lysinibacillus composti]